MTPSDIETSNRFCEGGIVALMFTKRQLEGRGRYWGASPSGNCWNAVTVFNNIVDFLRKSGINYQQGGIVGSFISIGVNDRGVLPPEPPLTVQYHPNSETRAKALMAALSKYAHGETLFSPDPQHGENEIKLTFNGTPKFPYADGSVLLE